MVTEVCSIYVRRAGDVLELFATKGLRAEAVHQTRLRVGEGLVGEIAANGAAAGAGRRAEPSRISPTGRKPARRSTTR